MTETMPMVALACLLAAASLFSSAAAQSSLVGAPAPEFRLQTLDGKEVSLRSLRGQTVVLHFWATYWTSCYADMGHLDKLSREFKKDGVAVFGINVGQLPRVVREFVKKKGYTYPQLINARGELILSFQATDAPAVVIISKNGDVVAHLVEEQGEQQLRSALRNALR